MARSACCVVLGSLMLYGASCFVAPGTTPRSPGQSTSGSVAGAQVSPSLVQEPAASTFSPLAFGAALGLLAAVFGARPALAVDLENGESIFTGNCAACHSGGNNTIVSEKKLKKEALVTYGKYDVGAIIKQVTNGNGSMPAFGGMLGQYDIEDVANWVFKKADTWET